ncbi:alpha/beta hydrolase [Paraburkholderia fungorum]|uniref:alpha/beta hydrolase n=1 Tax=Paraburkholderia fungorum TaxID=134537 RepID=UPI00402B8782
MFIQTQLGLCVEDVQIAGHAQTITLRSYRPGVQRSAVPVILYFHGGAFTSGTLADGDIIASFIAKATPAWVISVGYSLAPQFPFPHATEDGYRALLWAVSQARAQRADPRRVGLAGHDAGGNIATCVAAIARDRSEVKIGAQVLIAPLLDPSMTRVADEADAHATLDLGACARCYADYLPNPMSRLHPYAAPIESCRLWGLPPALICSVQSDRLHIEAERYASALIAAGVPTEVTRYRNTSRRDAACDDATLSDMVSFFRKRLAVGRRNRRHTEEVDGEFDLSENT